MAISACSIQADFESASFRCDVVARCPSGQECVDGLCGGERVVDASPVDAAPVDPFLSPWTATAELPEVRDYNHQHAAVSNGFVYLIGGYGPELAEVATVFFAQANPDGTLGAWNTTAPLPAARALSDAVASDGVLYVVGGADGSVAKSSVYYAMVAGDGTVPEWTPTTSLPAPRKAHACLIANGYLYAIGGGDAGNARVATVYFAKIQAGGAVGAWQVGTPLPQPRANMSAVQVDDVLYVMGGDDADEIARPSVFHAPIDSEDGAVGTWGAAPDLPEARLWGSAAAAAGYIYLIGGNAGGEASGVLHAPIEENGATGEWELDTALPAPRIRHAVADVGDYFYVMGGMTTDVVYAATPGP